MKKLLMFLLLLPLCSFTKSNLSTESYDFIYQTSYFDRYYNIENKFNYGQEFICLSPMEDASFSGYEQLELVKNDKDEYVCKINTPNDAKKYLINVKENNSWKLNTNDTYQIVPIVDFYSSALTSDLRSSYSDLIARVIYGLDTDERNPDRAELDSVLNDYDLDGCNPTLTLKDTFKPVIEGYNGTIVSNIDYPLSIEEIKSYLRAYDDVDGDITSSIKIDEDNYTANKNKLGTYPIKFSVSDKSNNTAHLTINVHVVDATKPVINAPSEIVSNLSNPKSIEDIKAMVRVSDNVDKDLTFSVVDNYSENKNVPGNYTVIVNTKDNSNNSATHTIKVKVVDDIKPTISGTSTIKTSIFNQIKVEDIKNMLTANDNVDGPLTNFVIVEDNYTTNYNKLGSYQIKFKVSDSSKNDSDEFIVTINVVDEVIPTFHVHEFIVNMDTHTTLSNEQIIDVLINSNAIRKEEISDKDKQIVITYNNYKQSQNEGKYKMNLKITYDSGEVQDLKIIINKEGFTPIKVNTFTKFINNFTYFTMRVNDYIDHFIKSIYYFFYNLFK